MKQKSNLSPTNVPEPSAKKRFRMWVSLWAIVLFLLILIAIPASRLRTRAAGQSLPPGISESAARQIEALIAEKESRTPAQQKIDSQLIYATKLQTGQSIAAGVQTLEVAVGVDNENRTVVDITATINNNLLAQFTKSHADILYSTPQYNSVRVRVALDQLEAIADLPEVRFIQPKQESITRQKRLLSPEGTSSEPANLSAGFPARAQQVRTQLASALSQEGAVTHGILPNGTLGVGSATTEGDTTHRASTARGTFNVNGTGIKIGVISDGVTNLAASQTLGDLGTVTVLPGQAGSGDEGTAMLEIIHDIAPGAQLFFATANPTITQFAQNIRDLRTAGCDIIVDDVGYYVESAFQDGQALSIISNTNGGVVTQAVNDVVAAGALYFSSAANSGNKNDNTSTTWEGDFVSGGTLAVVPGGGLVNDFDPSAAVATSNIITVGGGTGVPINLSWSDPLGGSSNDYDLFILNNAGTTVSISSTNVQSGTQDPYEQVNTNNTTGRRVVIRQKTGAANRFMHLSLNGGLITFNTPGETHGHAAATGCYGVAATPAFTAFSFTPPIPFGPYPNAYSSTDMVERFSSDGPRKIFYQGNGTAITPGDFSSTGGTTIQQPVLTAADGVAVTGVGGFSNPFFGTSAAAPHAAAIAALLRSANPAFTQAQLKTALTTTAIDIETAGTDRDAGFGIVMPYPALQSLGVTGKAFLELGTVTASEAGCNNGNGMIQPGEGATMTVNLKNAGLLNATGISATLATTTPGVTINNGTSAYSDLAATSGTGNNSTAFTFTLDPSAAVDVVINFTLTVSYTGGWNASQVVNFTVATGRAPITTVLDTTAPTTTTSFPTAATGTQTNLVFPDDPASTCAAPTAFPGTLTSTTPRFDSYTLTNITASPVCATVTLTPDKSALGALQAVAYTGTFNPASVGTNYLADAGFTAIVFPGYPQVFSCTVPASSNVVIVVVELKSPANGFPSALNSTYTLKVAGLPVSVPTTPTITCPTNVTQSTDAGQCTAVVSYPAPTLSGGCGTITCTPPSGATFAKGTTTVNCSVTGGSSCSFTVTVNDTLAPTVACPANITQNTDAGVCTAVVNYTTPAINDNCPGGSVSCSPASGSTFNKGVTTVTCTATDASSNTGNCTFTVTVNDTTPPTVTCPANQSTVASGPAVINYTTPTANDNCPGATVSCSPSSGSTFPLGTTTVTCTATDTSSNTGSCTFTVTVTQSCAITCPANVTKSTDAGQCTAVVNYTAPTTTGSCGSVTCTPSSGSIFAKGTTTVNCSEPGGANCSFTVTVNDTQAPTVACPANITQNTDAGVCTAVVNYTTPAINDNCPGGSVSCSPASGSTFNKGVTTVTCTATDASSNTGNCTFTVTVNDTTPPTVTCPANITQSTTTGQCLATVTYTVPTATDNCPGVGTVTCTPASGSTFPKGTTTVNCSVMDASANPGSCSFIVTVNDNQMPTLTGCPANQTINTASGTCSATATYTAPTATDNCPGVGTVSCTPASGSTFQKGTTTVTCSVTDASSNTASCSFTITVADHQNPTISCPGNITANGNGPMVVNYTTPVANDNCPGATASCSPASGSTFPVGTTTVTCTATDTSSNTASCSFTVTVVACTISCPGNITTGTTANQCGAVVNYPAPMTSGSCGKVTCSPAAGSFFPKGTTTVTCSTQSGPSCSFTVTVNDIQPPTIVCPGSIALALAPQCPPGTGGYVLNYAQPTFSDNCPGASVICVPPAGTSFPKGTTTVTCTATDAVGMTGSCSFIVKVFDIGLEDDSVPGTKLMFNSQTGEYLYICNGTSYTGTGTVVKQGCTVTLAHNTTTRRLQASVDLSQMRGSATLQQPVTTVLCPISDRKLTNNTNTAPIQP